MSSNKPTTSPKEPKMIPACDYKKFGLITKNTKLKLYTGNGHWPEQIKLSDLKMSEYLSKPKHYMVEGQKQIRHGGGLYYDRLRISVVAAADLRISFPAIEYKNSMDAKRIDKLYAALVEMCLKASKEYLDTHYKKFPGLAKKLLDRLEDRILKTDDTFRILSSVTHNIKTKDRCEWKTGDYKTPAGDSEKRVRLARVNGKKSESLPKDVLIEAVGQNMWTDQCSIGMREIPMCVERLRGLPK